MCFAVDWLEMLEVEVIAVQKERGAVVSFSVPWRNTGIYPLGIRKGTPQFAVCL